MSSNYPPGVTGREPQIAGYPEIERELTCDGEDVEVTIVDHRHLHEVGVIARGLREFTRELDGLTMMETKRRLRQMADLLEYHVRDSYTTTLEHCPFSDELTWTIDGFELSAECPVCGKTTTEDWSADPDADRDDDDRVDPFNE